MSEDKTCAWWIRGDELSVTACGRKLDGDEQVQVTWVEKNVTCDECLKVLRAAGLANVEKVG